MKHVHCWKSLLARLQIGTGSLTVSEFLSSCLLLHIFCSFAISKIFPEKDSKPPTEAFP
jgi:hypothetical protein